MFAHIYFYIKHSVLYVHKNIIQEWRRSLRIKSSLWRSFGQIQFLVKTETPIWFSISIKNFPSYWEVSIDNYNI